VNAVLLVRPAERETIVVLSNTEPLPVERIARHVRSLLARQSFLAIPVTEAG